jgi:hypothetical protein
MLSVRSFPAMRALAALAALAFVALIVQRDGGAVSFNGAASSMPTVDSGNRLCAGPVPHPGPLNVVGDFFACPDVLAPGAPVNLRQKLQITGGNVLTNPQVISYSTGLVVPPLPVGVAIGDYAEDIDLGCDGATDRLATAPIMGGPAPAFIVNVPPAASYAPLGYGSVMLPMYATMFGPVPRSTPQTLGFYFLDPTWAGSAPTTVARLVIRGGDPNPPGSHTTSGVAAIPHPRDCLQNPHISTTQFPGGSGGPITHTNAAIGPVLLWEMYIGEPDYRDGLIQVGPTGGMNLVGGGIAVPPGALRNLQCIPIAAAVCPVGAALWADLDLDGLPDAVEGAWGSAPGIADTDGDGLSDFEEMALMTDPTLVDTDGEVTVDPDDLTDGIDNCPLLANLGQLDTDGDAIGNACDLDDDNDGLVDTNEAIVGGGLYLAYIDTDPLGGEQGGYACRPIGEAVAMFGAAAAAALAITTGALVADTDGDGVLDGKECEAGSSPGPSGGAPPGMTIAVCQIAPMCTTGLLATMPIGTMSAAFAAAGSLPEILDAGAPLDEDGDGNLQEVLDPDMDGLANHLEILRRTTCARPVGPALAAVLAPGACFAAAYANDLDGDAVAPGTVDLNSDGQGPCAAWVGGGHPFPAGIADGCDGPEFYVGLSETRQNEDGDGRAYFKGPMNTTLAHPVGGLGGCTTGEELGALLDTSVRDFRDVNGTGTINAVDIGIVRAAFGDSAAVPGSGYLRTNDLNPPSATGNGSGEIDAVDTGLVRTQFGLTCVAAP